MRTCSDAVQAEQALRGRNFDVILLDAMLPGRSSFDFCAGLRDRDIQTPVLMLSAHDTVTERVAGLRIGADDFLAKPFETQELLARIEALRRRRGRDDDNRSGRFHFADVCVDFDSQSAFRAGHRVELSRREFQLLRHLIRNRGRVVLRDELLQVVWGYSILPYTRTVDVHMWQLRRKLERDPRQPRFLRTIRGAGYLLTWSRYGSVSKLTQLGERRVRSGDPR